MIIRKSFFIISAATALFLTSCQTTQPVAGNTSADDIQIQPPMPELPGPVVIPPAKSDTAYKRYKDFIDGIALTMASAPKATAKGHAFSSPFSVKVTKSADGTPAEGIELTVRYPVAKTDDDIQYAETTITSNGNGTANFTPPVPQTTVNGTVTIFPAGDTSDPEIAAAAQLVSVTAAYQVRTNLLQSGGCIAIVDCSPNGTPITARSDSSSGVLTEMMKKGFVRVGNIDFVTEVMTGDKNRVYNAAKPMIGGSTAYLIFGTVRYAQPIQKTADGCTCTLSGDITCLSMKDGSVLYHTTRTATATDAREQQALAKARADLARQIADAVYYGL
ncbi:MAG: hypothetical protein K2N31_02625 [Treponemataceae bacterium]|nr:hypothetical protein [Treponemataceae bacterium]